MRTLGCLHLGAIGLLMLGVIVAWGTSMPHELTQENSQLIGGFEPWCPCYDVEPSPFPCADKPGQNCPGTPRTCKTWESGDKGWCQDDGLICDDTEKCDEGDGYVWVDCTEPDEPE